MKFAIVSLFLTSLFAAAQTVSVPLTRPIALDRLREPSTDLFALTPDKVYALHEEEHGLQVAGSFSLPSYESPSDIVVALINGEKSLIVSGRNPRFGGFVSIYTLTGQKLRSWISQRPLCGMDYDGRDAIYAASCDTNEIYAARLKGKDSTQFVTEVFGAHHLGSVIVDTIRTRLIVGEIDDGEIYAVDLEKRRTSLLSRGFSSPQAFALSSDLQQLFVADSSQRKIYRLDLTKPNASPVALAALPQFQTPDGLSLLPSGRIAVADDRANAIFTLAIPDKFMRP